MKTEDELKRHTAHLRGPIYVALFFALCAFAVIGISTQSAGYGLSLALPIFASICLWRFGIPPLMVARGFGLVRDSVGLLVAALGSIFFGEKLAPFVGLLAAIGVVAWSIAYLFKLASDSFRELIEIIPLGESIRRDSTSGLLISHVSDIHITKDDQTARAEKGPGGQQNLDRWVSVIRGRAIPILVISGDVTDTGEDIEWARFNSAVERLGSKIAIVPGNHDLSKRYGSSKDNKARLYFETLAKLNPDVVACTGEKLSRLAARADQEIGPDVEKRAASNRNSFISTDVGKVPGEIPEPGWLERREEREEMATTMDWLGPARERELNDWFDKSKEGLFPLRYEHHSSNTVVLMLNSVITSASTIGESAIGQFGEEQLSRLAAELWELPSWTQNVVLVTHHAPFRRPGEWESFFANAQREHIVSRVLDYAFLVHRAEEARKFVTTISGSADKHDGVNYFLLCGHRHKLACGRIGRIITLEGASLSVEPPTTWMLYTQATRVTVSNLELTD